MYVWESSGSVSHFVEFRDDAHSHSLVERAADKEAKLGRGRKRGGVGMEVDKAEGRSEGQGRS